MFERMAKDKARKQYELVLGESTSTRPIERVPEKRSRYTVWYYIGLANQIGLSISLPIALGAIGGGLVDLRMNSRPQYTLIGLVIGLVISLVNFYSIVSKIIKSSKQH